MHTVGHTVIHETSKPNVPSLQNNNTTNALIDALCKSHLKFCFRNSSFNESWWQSDFVISLPKSSADSGNIAYNYLIIFSIRADTYSWTAGIIQNVIGLLSYCHVELCSRCNLQSRWPLTCLMPHHQAYGPSLRSGSSVHEGWQTHSLTPCQLWEPCHLWQTETI